nr:uncharacterized protein LOC108007324 isoform X1 [Drosophila suzukii]
MCNFATTGKVYASHNGNQLVVRLTRSRYWAPKGCKACVTHKKRLQERCPDDGKFSERASIPGHSRPQGLTYRITLEQLVSSQKALLKMAPRQRSDQALLSRRTRGKQTYRCRVCRGIHPLKRCQRFRKLSAEKRLRAVLTNKYCSNCLDHEHSQGNCRRFPTGVTTLCFP